MGIRISVYRNNRGDCTNGGQSSKFETFTVTNVDGPFEPDDEAPGIRLVKGNLPGTVKLVPECIPEGVHVMFGGNYGATSDSRFSEAVARIACHRYGAVPIHDRVEGSRHA